ncbi:unnamed protein product [marine sediment metagenome]|uniref:Uncharacterized protein n=1 Tax=marine sediment metagenome TaxID=412755 RepID=X1ING2_9ZZZZ
MNERKFDVLIMSEENDKDKMGFFELVGLHQEIISKLFDPTLTKEERVLQSNFDNADIYLGSNYNVVHVDFHRGGNFDLVLLTESNFDRQYKSIKNFKRKHL